MIVFVCDRLTVCVTMSVRRCRSLSLWSTIRLWSGGVQDDSKSSN